LATRPDNVIDAALWVRTHLAINQFYTYSLKASSVLTCPVIAAQENMMSEEARVFDD
jgi:hypothetical protein